MHTIHTCIHTYIHIQIKCEFCGTEYKVAKDDIEKELLSPATGAAATS